MSTVIGITYPVSPVLSTFELKQCENCPDLFTRLLGSTIKFCGHCIATQLMRPIPWCRGSLSAYVRGGDAMEEGSAKTKARRPQVASKECHRGQHFMCSKVLDCPCSCHPRHAQR